jgi:hypothetical protein|tara:strand:- start:356 stop:544 length:189 start_codon:yes stop_codon:yes gene_type:complete
MNNEQALDALRAQQQAINLAINELNRYVREKTLWKSDDVASQLTEVKRLATVGGANISAWSG